MNGHFLEEDIQKANKACEKIINIISHSGNKESHNEEITPRPSERLELNAGTALMLVRMQTIWVAHVSLVEEENGIPQELENSL